MKVRKLFLGVVLALGLGLAAHPAVATVVTSIPGGTVISMPAVNYFGPGPEDLLAGDYLDLYVLRIEFRLFRCL